MIDSKNKLQKDSPVPLYYQLRQALRAELGEGAWAVGQQFSTEEELTEKYNISRATVQKALEGLVNDGLLDRQQGRGTVVRALKVELWVDRSFSFTQEARWWGKIPSSRILSFDCETGADEICQWLELPMAGLRHSPCNSHDYCLRLNAGHLATEGLYSSHDNSIA